MQAVYVMEYFCCLAATSTRPMELDATDRPPSSYEFEYARENS